MLIKLTNMPKTNQNNILLTLLTLIIFLTGSFSSIVLATPSSTIRRDVDVTAVVQGETTSGTSITLNPDGKVVETKIVTYNQPDKPIISGLGSIEQGISTVVDFILPRTGGLITKTNLTNFSLLICLISMLFCLITLSKNKKKDTHNKIEHDSVTKP
jgi:hypothetical protein